jgi:hypothetical protein
MHFDHKNAFCSSQSSIEMNELNVQWNIEKNKKPRKENIFHYYSFFSKNDSILINFLKYIRYFLAR